MEEIIAYLKEKYQPTGMIVYGSFADGSNNLNSDFDALVITDFGNGHDHSMIAGTQLDVFLCTETELETEQDIEKYVRLRDGRIVMDERGIIGRTVERVNTFLAEYTGKSAEENAQNLAWCRKMLRRTERGDMEGLFRLHWLVTDSLEIYFDRKKLYYFGPKKGIRYLKENDPTAAELYKRVLELPNEENLSNWIDFLENIT